MSEARIILTRFLPNVVSSSFIVMSTTVGLDDPRDRGPVLPRPGSQPPVADLGSMLGEARSALITNPPHLHSCRA